MQEHWPTCSEKTIIFIYQQSVPGVLQMGKERSVTWPVLSRLQFLIHLWNPNASLRWSFSEISFSLAVWMYTFRYFWLNFTSGRKMLDQMYSILENVCLTLLSNLCFPYSSSGNMYTPRTWTYSFPMSFCFRSVWLFFFIKVCWENEWHAYKGRFTWGSTVLCDMKWYFRYGLSSLSMWSSFGWWIISSEFTVSNQSQSSGERKKHTQQSADTMGKWLAKEWYLPCQWLASCLACETWCTRDTELLWVWESKKLKHSRKK